MTWTGWRAFATCVNINDGGAFQWLDNSSTVLEGDEVSASGDDYARAGNVISSAVSQILRCRNAGFTTAHLPSDATPTGNAQIRLTRQGANTNVDHTIRLSFNNAGNASDQTGSNYASGTAWQSGSYRADTFAVTHPWTADQIRSAPPGVDIKATVFLGQIDLAEIRYEYSTGAETTVNDASHGQSADAPTTTFKPSTAPNDAAHAHSADQPMPAAHVSTAPASGAHAHDADAPATLLKFPPAPAVHAHAADSPIVTPEAVLAPNDATHGLTNDAIVLSPHVSIAPADALHAHGADAATAQIEIVVAGAFHAHSAENPTSVYRGWLMVDPVVAAWAAGSATAADWAPINPTEATWEDE